VWVGYPRAEIPLVNVEGLGGVFGGSLPAQIWHEFTAGATQGLRVLDFAQPNLSGDSQYSSSSSSDYSSTAPPQTGPRTVTVVPPPPA
jgi:membrane peptidoglycan carboxypeptidase